MRYSLGFKETQVKKVLPPHNQSIASVAREAGVADQTLRNWLEQVKNGTLKEQGTVGGASRSAREKFSLVMESKSIADNDHGRWLREKGLHSEHITLYEQELRDLVEDKGLSEKEENKRLKKENKRLQKELAKKEKALAEMAALYTLKKKAEELWGESEDD
jgi:transposase-like protein